MRQDRLVITSSCVRVCRYGTDDVCLGCFRLRSEVADWAALDEGSRIEVAALAAARRERRWQERAERRLASAASPAT